MPVLPSYSNQSIICCANQLTGFYMRATLVLNGLISTRVLLIHTIPVTPFAVQFVTKEIIVGIVWSHSRLSIVLWPTQNKRKWWYFAFLFFFFTKKSPYYFLHWRKIPNFPLISWCWNFLEKHSFRIFSVELPEVR